MRTLLIACLLLLTVSYSTSLKAQVLPPLVETAKTEPAPTVTAIPELSSPRQTFRTFLAQMEDYAEGHKESISLAMQCMDLSDIPEFSRNEQGVNLAIKLHTIISKTRIEATKITSQPNGSEVILRSDEFGVIAIDKSGGNWKFSKTTIRNIPELYFRLKDEKAVSNLPLSEADILNSFSLRQYVPQNLTDRIASVEYWQLIGIFVSLLFAYAARFCSFYILRKTTRFLTTKFETFPAIKSIDGFVSPVSYLLAVYMYQLCIYMLDLDPVVYARILRILVGIKIFLAILVAVRAVDLLAEIIVSKSGKFSGSTRQILIPLCRSIAKFVMFFSGLVLIAKLYGIDLTSVLAGLGIGGIAIALAAKDTVENLFGSITVLFDKPFNVGDAISIEGVSGVVENIGLRSTRLRTPENSLLTIPNSKLISVVVDNLGARRYIRTRLSLGVTYETPLEKLEQFCAGIKKLLANDESVRSDFLVYFNQFADSSLNILVQAYFNTSSYSDHLAKQEKFFFNIIKLANYLGVEFAYPVQRQINSSQQPSEGNPVDKASLDTFIAALKAR